MLEPAFTWIRSLKDPFRNPNAAAQWIAGLPATDAIALQKEALELVASFPGSRRIVGPAQAEALLRVDARLEPVLAQLAQQYATNYQKSTDVETRLWHAVFDLVKAFTAAYAAVLRAGYPRAEHKRWHGLLPWILVRLVHYRGHRRQIPAVPLRHVDSRAMARVPRALRIRARTRLAAERARVRRRHVLAAGRVRRAGIPEDAAAHASRFGQFHARSGRMGRAAAGWLGGVADAGAAPGFRGELLRRSDGVARVAPPGQGALGRPRAVARRRPDLHADRRAHALAARTR